MVPREVVPLILMEMMKGMHASNMLYMQYMQKVGQHIRLQHRVSLMMMSSNLYIRDYYKRRTRSIEQSRMIKQKYKKRKFWVDPKRTSQWWINLYDGSLPESTWQESLGMTKDNFMALCDELRPFIHRERSTFRKPITVEARVAMTLHYLVAEGGGLGFTAAKFGIAKSTLCIIIREVCQYIKTELAPKHIQLPKGEACVRQLSDGFKSKHGIPQCIGSISTTEVKLLKSQNKRSGHRAHRKPVYSLNVQAACDWRLKFFDVVVVKSQGDENACPAAVFNNCTLNASLRDRVIPPCPTKVVPSEPEIPIYLLGDSCYPLRTYLMKNYSPAETSKEEFFNTKSSYAANATIHNAFDIVKERFRILKTAMTMRLEFLPTIIYACFALHNFLHDRGDLGHFSKTDRPKVSLSNYYDIVDDELDISQARIIRDICSKSLKEIHFEGDHTTN